MKAKKLVALLLAGMLAVSAAACSGGDNSSSTASNDSNTTSDTSSAGTESSELEAKDIVWAGWSGEEDSTKEIINYMIDSYNEKGGSQVTWVGWPWADTQQQLLLRNQGSDQLDVAQVDITMFGALANAGILVDMNELMGEDYLKENYDAAALEVGQFEGQQLGMPWSIASTGMVYNPSLLKEVGYDEPPTTIEEFEDCMQKLKEKDPEIIPYGVATKDATMATDFQPWLWTFGGKLLNDDGTIAIDSENTIKALDWYKSLVDKGYIQTGIARQDSRQLFAQGKMAFYDDAITAQSVAISNGVAEDELDDKIMPMVRPVLNEGDTPQSGMWGHLLVVFKKSENQAQAADFIKHLVSEEVSLKYLDSNAMLPVLNSALESDEVKNNAWASTWAEGTKSGKQLEFALMPNGTALNNIIVEEVQGVLLGNTSSADAAKAMADRLTAEMK